MSLSGRITPDRAVLAGIFLAAAVYCQDLRYDFLLDDIPFILMSVPKLSWLGAKGAFATHISSAPAGDVPLDVLAAHYRPVYTLWQMLHGSLFGAVLPWWHLTSLLLHICVVVLVYLVGRQVLKQSWPAALGALLFALHPIHAESVSYVSAATDLLATLFLLISFLFYIRFREQEASPAYLIVSVFAAALAVLSKEIAVIFPLTLVAYEAVQHRKPGAQHSEAGASTRWQPFMWTLPFFAVVAAYTVVRTWLCGFNTGPGPGFSRWIALLDAPLVFLVYLRNLLWSFRLSFFYPVEWSSQWTVAKGCGLVLAAIVVLLLWKYSRARPDVRLLLLWTAILFVIPVASVSAFIRQDWVHDRHMYLVSVPFCLLAGALLTNPAFPGKFRIPLCSLILAILFIETASQVPRFKDGVTVYASALKVDPNDAIVHDGYARSLSNSGNQEEALREFRITTELAPKWSFARDTYALLLIEAGRDDEAASELATALRWSPAPNLFRAHLLYELAALELKSSDPALAADHLREAVQIAPRQLSYHTLLAKALRQQGREQDAQEELRVEAKLRQQAVRRIPASY